LAEWMVEAAEALDEIVRRCLRLNFGVEKIG
jgi:hypothetical protein